MNKPLKMPTKTISVAISHLPEQVTSHQHVLQLIVPNVSYLLIPGHLEALPLTPQPFLRWLLPHSKHTLIDVALPYLYSRHRSLARVLARYILFGQKLIGIRVQSCQDWPVDRVERVSPPVTIQKYYRQNRLPFDSNEVLVGNFYLQFLNCRMALLFDRELTTSPQLLSVLQRYKCEVVSVVANIQKEINKDSQVLLTIGKQKEAISKLKVFIRTRKMVLLYGGCRIVPDMATVYWDRSFVMQGDILSDYPKTLVGQVTQVGMVVDLYKTSQNKWLNTCPLFLEETEVEGRDICLSKLQVEDMIRPSRAILIKQVAIPSIKKVMNDIVGRKEMLLFNLYYLYRAVNKSSPFVLPYPFSRQRTQLFNHLQTLEEYSELQLQQLVKVYSYREDPAQNRSKLSSAVKVHDSFDSMMKEWGKEAPQLIFLYCEEGEEVNKLKGSSEYGNRICNCDSLIPFSMKEKKPRQQAATNMQILQSKKIERACLHVLKERYQSIDQILEYFWECHFNKKQIQKCFSEVLPRKVKKYLKLTPHYLFLIHATPQRIVGQIGQAEIRLKSRGKGRIIVEADQEQGSMEGQQPKRLAQNIENARQYKSRVSQQLRCHLCQIGFKKELIYTCPKCKSVLCFDCIDSLTNHVLFQMNAYKCAICLGKCSCDICRPIKDHRSPEKEDEMDFFFKGMDFECSRCQILGEVYDRIKFECVQCKNFKCYNCSRMNRGFDPHNMASWICFDCDEFNLRMTRKASKDAKDLEQLLRQSPQIQQENQINLEQKPSLERRHPQQPINARNSSQNPSFSKSQSRSRSPKRKNKHRSNLSSRSSSPKHRKRDKDRSKIKDLALKPKSKPLWGNSPQKAENNHKNDSRGKRKKEERGKRKSQGKGKMWDDFSRNRHDKGQSKQHEARPKSGAADNIQSAIPEGNGLIFERKEYLEPESFSY